jgi:hypothetical protein
MKHGNALLVGMLRRRDNEPLDAVHFLRIQNLSLHSSALVLLYWVSINVVVHQSEFICKRRFDTVILPCYPGTTLVDCRGCSFASNRVASMTLGTGCNCSLCCATFTPKVVSPGQ